MLDRLRKREALRQREELEDVAAGAAAEAIEEALVAIDVKRRRLLAMKRAEAFVALAGELERRDLADEVDDVGRGAHLRDDAVVEIYVQFILRRSEAKPKDLLSTTLLLVPCTVGSQETLSSLRSSAYN